MSDDILDRLRRFIASDFPEDSERALEPGATLHAAIAEIERLRGHAAILDRALINSQATVTELRAELESMQDASDNAAIEADLLS